MAKYNTEEDALKALKIDDFRHLSKDKVMQFMSMIPDMDKEVAMKCIEQFPNFKDFGLDIFAKLNEGYLRIIDSGKDSAKKAMEAYELILQTMKEMLEKDNLTFEEKRQIAFDMVTVADKIAEQDSKWKEFLGKFAQGLGVGAVAVAAIIATALGVKIDTNKFQPK